MVEDKSPSRNDCDCLASGLGLAICACAHCRPCEECGPRACTSQDRGSKSG